METLQTDTQTRRWQLKLKKTSAIDPVTHLFAIDPEICVLCQTSIQSTVCLHPPNHLFTLTNKPSSQPLIYLLIIPSFQSFIYSISMLYNHSFIYFVILNHLSIHLNAFHPFIHLFAINLSNNISICHSSLQSPMIYICVPELTTNRSINNPPIHLTYIPSSIVPFTFLI